MSKFFSTTTGRRRSGVISDLKAFPISVHVDPTDTFTTVVMVGERYGAIGTAKRNPRDKFNPQTGVDLALARALREMADNLEAGTGL